MTLPAPYAHQTRTVEAVKRAYREGARSIVVVIPTGGGKTLTATMVAGGGRAKGRRVAWLAHREELVDQGAASLARLGVRVGVVKAGRAADPEAPIQVASVQTLHARPAELPPADIVVVDECHHATAATWRALLARWPKLELVLGLTATPERGDRTPLGRSSGGVFEALVSETSVAELQRTARPDGHPILVPCRVIGPAKPQRELFRDPVEGLLQFGRNSAGRLRPSILFAASVPEAEAAAEAARRRGIRAASIDGSTPSEERRRSLEAFAAGELDLLTNVFVLTEGFDSPRAEVCAIARGCSASSTFLQMVGRVLRSSPETGKRDALLIDYRGLSYQHGLVEHARSYSLDGKAITCSAGDGPRAFQCPRCSGVFAPAERCPYCQALQLRPRERQATRRTEAVAITKTHDESYLRGYFDQLRSEARAKGHKPGWVGYRFQARFGFWPKWAMK